jgi:hypothetical protein
VLLLHPGLVYAAVQYILVVIAVLVPAIQSKVEQTLWIPGASPLLSGLAG